MKTRKTPEEFSAEINFLTNSEFEVIGQYKNKNIKVEFKHNKCCKTFTEAPTVFLDNLKCKACGESVNLEEIYNVHNHEEFMVYVNDHANGKFKVLSEYQNMDTRVQVECLKCGHKDNVLPRKWLRTFFCHRCDGGIKQTIFDVIDLVYQKHRAKFAVLDSSIPKDDYYSLVHVSCGQITKAKLSKILQDDFDCKECSAQDKQKPKRNPRMSTKEYAKKVSELSNREFKLVGECHSVDDLVNILCKKCGKVFPITAKQFLANMKCPHCEHMITGVIKDIAEYLRGYGYKCIPGYTFDDCINISRPLRFNLAIFRGNQLKLVVEHDTIHHYIPIYGMEILKASKNLGAVKTKYCEEHNIKLIRIPFWQEDKFKDILKQELLYGDSNIDTEALRQNLIGVLEGNNILISPDDKNLDKFIVYLAKAKNQPITI